MTKKSEPRRWHALIAAAGCIALAAPGIAGAVERCIGAQGEPMFSQNCPRSVPRQRVQPGRSQTVAVRAGSLCPRSPQQLEQQLQSALDTRSGVRLSGLALWRGVPARTARGQARELLQLLKAGSATVALEAAAPADEDAPYRPPGATLLVMPVTERLSETHSEQLRFAIVRDHGCYWLSPSPQRVFDEGWQARADTAPPPEEPHARYGR